MTLRLPSTQALLPSVLPTSTAILKFPLLKNYLKQIAIPILAHFPSLF